MKLASIEKLHSVRVHPNADTLMCGKVLAWPVVFRKGEFQEGCLGVFIVPDVIVDSTNLRFNFLEKNKFKIWTAKFRGEPSSGLLMPLGLLNDYLPTDRGSLPQDAIKYFTEGTDVGDLIKCVKYEKPIKNLDARGGFPTHYISMSDEDNLLSNPRVFEELKAAGPLYITLKCDGSSGTFIRDQADVHVCSRRQDLYLSGKNEWTHVVQKYDLINKTPEGHIILQFEVVGPGIQDNRMGLKEVDMRVFRAVNTWDRKPVGYQALQLICNALEVPMVPVVCENYIPTTLDDLVKIADSQKYENGKPAEGIVIQPVNPVQSEILGKSLSVKIINSNYKQ